MNYRRIPAVIAAVSLGLTLTACGGGNESLDSGKAIADKVGCTNLKDVKEKGSFAQEEYECKYTGGETVGIWRAGDRESVKMLGDMAGGFGISYMIVNDNWAVSCELRPVCTEIAEKLDVELA